MREIKFRAWIPQGHWIADNEGSKTGQYIYDWQDTVYLECMPFQPKEHQNEGVVLEQYTGLKDKNGREIYEGDILRFLPDRAYPEKETISVVRWDISTAAFEFISKKGAWGWEEGDETVQEVIGNIHENPELLK